MVNFGQKKRFVLLLVIAVIVLVVWVVSLLSGNQTSRTESYKDTTGAAGLTAAIDYKCSTQCDQKFDFNVYIFGQDGQQISVVRPNQDGNVTMALPEGDYIMLIGKQFGKNKGFPQESLALKNGKTLELKLHYKEGAL